MSKRIEIIIFKLGFASYKWKVSFSTGQFDHITGFAFTLMGAKLAAKKAIKEANATSKYPITVFSTKMGDRL